MLFTFDDSSDEMLVLGSSAHTDDDAENGSFGSFASNIAKKTIH